MTYHGSSFCGAADATGRSGRGTDLPAFAPVAAWRAFLRVAGRHLARRTSRYLGTIDPRDLDALVREAREFASLMHIVRAGLHRYWRRVCNARLADAQR